MIGLLIAQRYRIVAKVGEGGMAIVYLAHDVRTDHDVALKFLRPEFLDQPDFIARFQREAMAASKMSHHNIVNLLDVGEYENTPYIVIEYMNGKTLKDVINARGKLPEDVAVQIGIRILSALQHAHGVGIIHRDIKPQNILVDQQGYIKVADFGIARMVGMHTNMGADGKADFVMGSVHYFSPEQAKGETATIASDLYAVGVVLYEMLCGKVPFEGETAVAIALQHLQEQPRPIRELNPLVSPALESVVMKALEKNPQNRYETALDMARALKNSPQFPEKEGTQDTPVFAQPPQKKKTELFKSRKRLLGLALAALATLVVLAVLTVGTLTIYDKIVNSTRAPYLVGESEENALRLARNARLVPEIVRQCSKEEKGTVILQSHDYDYPMRSGDKILLTVSTGPVEQEVPKLLGMQRLEAEKLLDKMGLKLLMTKRVQDKAPAGTILKQSPKEGSKAAYGDIIQVEISGGWITVPDTKGKNKSEALKLLKDAGIEQIRITEIPVDDSKQIGRIADQLPEGGTIIMTETGVDLALYVAQPKPTNGGGH